MMHDRVLGVRAARIHTLTPEQPEAECLVLRRDAIEAVGSADEMTSLFGASFEWLDLRPAVIVPGLTDSHIHFVEWALGLKQPDLLGFTSMAEAIERIAHVAASAREDAWLEFKGWDPTWRAQAELADLDAASRGRAVVLVAHDLHSGWLNSESMRRLDIGPGRSDPEGGFVERDAEGRPTGVLKERALDWWYQGRPQPGTGDKKAAVLEGQAALHRLGTTAVHSVEAPDSFRVVEELARSGELALRVLHHMPQRFIDSLIECGIMSGFGDEWLRVGGIKYFTDGALGSRTAWMLEPYEDAEGCGIRRLGADEFTADVRRAAQAGLAATVHAIGDAAVRMTLDAIESADSPGLAIPHRIEHLQCVHPDDLGRASAAGIVGSMQPSHLLTDVRLAESRWGPERSRQTYALRSLLDAGTVLAFGSDAPVEAADPREGFYAAVARRDRDGYPASGWNVEERLTTLEVLRGYTVSPAMAAGDADRRGRIAPGFAADFAAWNLDLVEADAENIRGAEVVATVVGGEVVYRA
jgi:predicted amidohydrolase YtcJ